MATAPIRLACPFCKVFLDDSPAELSCPRCGGRFPVIEGVPSFTSGDIFYEGRWIEPDRSLGTPRNWLIKKQRFFLQRLAGRRGRILDLGCGGGWAVFARVGPAAGVDLSRGSAASARAIYSITAAADLRSLPFADETFDVVVSSDVLGHVPLSDKDQVIAEIVRVLRPGGRTLHFIEADPDDPLSRYARRFPELYQRHVIDLEGHIGLESADQIFARFRRQGLRPIGEEGAYRFFLYLNRYAQCFDNEYRDRSIWFRLTAPIARVGVAVAPIQLAANVMIAALLEVGDRLLPIEWSSGALVEYVKE